MTHRPRVRCSTNEPRAQLSSQSSNFHYNFDCVRAPVRHSARWQCISSVVSSRLVSRFLYSLPLFAFAFGDSMSRVVAEEDYGPQAATGPMARSHVRPHFPARLAPARQLVAQFRIRFPPPFIWFRLVWFASRRAAGRATRWLSIQRLRPQFMWRVQGQRAAVLAARSCVSASSPPLARVVRPSVVSNRERANN